ncbi:MAG: hypothetical protein F6K31_17435 [Symploca sp. SIO2G7]|nr:hypothetical protein [Symploca sp. SIO2G7]
MSGASGAYGASIFKLGGRGRREERFKAGLKILHNDLQAIAYGTSEADRL